MARFRTTAVALGMAWLVGLGADDRSRAQAPGPADRPVSARQKLREKVIALRTEVEVLRLERDAMRAGLLKVMEGVEQGEILGIDVSTLMGSAKLELGGISGNAEAMKEMSDLMSKLQNSTGKDLEQVLGELKTTFTKQKNDFRAGLEKKKHEFANKIRTLNEKTLDLEDAERRYRETR